MFSCGQSEYIAHASIIAHSSVMACIIIYGLRALRHLRAISVRDYTQLQQDVDKILSWMASQGLTSNHTKTQPFPINRSRNALQINNLINGHQIVPVSSVKYLGVTISSDLFWSRHISIICKKAKRHIGLIHSSGTSASSCQAVLLCHIATSRVQCGTQMIFSNN